MSADILAFSPGGALSAWDDPPHTRRSARDEAVSAWREWYDIWSEASEMAGAAGDGPSVYSAMPERLFDRRLDALSQRAADAAERALRLRARTISGVAAQLHIALVDSEGFDEECVRANVRTILRGLLEVLRGDQQKQIRAYLQTEERKLAAD
jgi:hypothetical protein